jgi:hypothetical protein
MLVGGSGSSESLIRQVVRGAYPADTYCGGRRIDRLEASACECH